MRISRLLKFKGKPFFGMGEVLQSVGSLFINARVHVIFEPMTKFLFPLVYTFRFARWYNENSVRDHIVPTEERFGYENRYKLYDSILQHTGKENINYLEFGVATGDSLRWWVENNKDPASNFFGFDTFMGLPEDWGTMPKGTFSTRGDPPDIPDNRCAFEIGLFSDTLPAFLEKFSLAGNRTIVHIDADLYSSTLFVLATLAPEFKKGDIIIFDEFADVVHEFRAFVDFRSAYLLQLEVFRAVNYGNKIAFMVNA